MWLFFSGHNTPQTSGVSDPPFAPETQFLSNLPTTAAESVDRVMCRIDSVAPVLIVVLEDQPARPYLSRLSHTTHLPMHRAEAA
jgi:hypothetical protein